MILTHEQLIPLFKGALRVEMSATGYTAPRRFTEKGQEYYNTLGDFGKKARATSCVRLEMMTDSDLFSYEYTLEGASSRKFAYFDLVVDGTVLRHDGYEGISSMSGNITATLPAGTHHVALYFPNLFKGNIRNVTLSDGATFAPVEKSCRIYAVGDSITQGYDAKFSCGSYSNLLADMLNAEVVNHGIGGDVFHPDMIDADMPYTPDIITVAYGTNDWSGRIKEHTVEAANEYYRRLAAAFPKAKIFAITPIWRADEFRHTQVGAFADIIQIVTDAATAAGAVVIDGERMIPHSPAVCSDAYLHPNDLGFQYYAHNLYLAMKPHLEG